MDVIVTLDRETPAAVAICSLKLALNAAAHVTSANIIMLMSEKDTVESTTLASAV